MVSEKTIAKTARRWIDDLIIALAYKRLGRCAIAREKVRRFRAGRHSGEVQKSWERGHLTEPLDVAVEFFLKLFVAVVAAFGYEVEQLAGLC